jgi:5S rRNA maturation endonuclease (ribonuclease M5)
MSRRNTRTRASTSRKRKASDISISDETNKENQSSYEDEERKRVLKKAKVKALLEDFDNEGRKLRSNFNIDFSILIAV